MDKKSLQELIDESRASRPAGGVVVSEDETHYQINDHPYELLTNYRDAFDKMELSDRFNAYFSKYDYLVGDWGFGQLRLRGFYGEERNVPAEAKITALQDYLDENCNIGCPYFVLKNQDVRVVEPKKRKPRPSNSRRHRNGSHRNNATPQDGEQHQSNARNQSSDTRHQNNANKNNNHGRSNNGHNGSNNGNGQHRNSRNSGNNRSNHQPKRQTAYVTEQIKEVKQTPLSKRDGTVKTVGHSKHRRFTIREKKD